jgi:hypothetical protein
MPATRQEREIHETRAKAWCFDNGVAEVEIQAAWDRAVKADAPVVRNLNRDGYKWWWLPPHLLKQLIERYSTPTELEGSKPK